MAYWRLAYHFIWTTKNRAPLITSELEPHIYRWLHNEAKKMYCPFFYIGGVADHVHVVTAFRPSVSPSDFMKQLKGSSSRFVTLKFKHTFEWQEGYGVFSVSESDIDRVKAYVLHQKQHHAEQSIVANWEENHEWNLGPESLADANDG
jgi:putative transposase